MPTTPIDAIAELNTVLLREAERGGYAMLAYFYAMAAQEIAAEQRKIMIRPSDRPSAPN